MEQGDDLSQEYDEDAFMEQAKEDLENLQDEAVQKTGLPFLDHYLEKQDKAAREAAEDLLKKIENDEEISLEELKPDAPLKDEKFEGRMRFTNEKDKEKETNNKKLDIKKVLKAYINDSDDKTKKDFFEKEDLTQGLNLKNLKHHYKGKTIKEEDWTAFKQENDDLMDNLNVVTIQDNEKEFLEEKEKLYEEEVPKAEKKMSGWGSWTGKGV